MMCKDATEGMGRRGDEEQRREGGAPDPQFGASPRQGVSASPGSPLRVLLVDDHALFREGLGNLLASQGVQVVGVARDGLEALGEARRLRPSVILMDIQMPRCDGLAATRLIKAEMPECKVVMLTMLEDDEALFEAVRSGASGYLLKQLDAADFFSYLSELQAGHPPFAPGLAERILHEFAQQSGLPASPSLANPASPSSPTSLSSRQAQILTLVAQGRTYREVAETIGIAERTVKYHMAEVLERLHLRNRAQVIAYAARMGMVRPDEETC